MSALDTESWCWNSNLHLTCWFLSSSAVYLSWVAVLSTVLYCCNLEKVLPFLVRLSLAGCHEKHFLWHIKTISITSTDWRPFVCRTSRTVVHNNKRKLLLDMENIPSNVHRVSQISEVAGYKLGRPGQNVSFLPKNRKFIQCKAQVLCNKSTSLAAIKKNVSVFVLCTFQNHCTYLNEMW
jgi:hypothetical protein